jgi:hypothetical protein
LIFILFYKGRFLDDSDGTDIEFSEGGKQFLIAIRSLDTQNHREDLQLNLFVNGIRIKEELFID